jgi:hypothetical protein
LTRLHDFDLFALQVSGVARDGHSQHRNEKLIVHMSIIAGFPATIEMTHYPLLTPEQ